MSEKYYQEYGPIKRRRANGELRHDEHPQEPPKPLPPRPTRPTRRRARRQRRSLLGPLLFIVLVVGVTFALPYGTNLLSANQAIQGVSVGGKPVGGMTHAAIQAQLTERYASFTRTPVTITYEGRTWTPALDQLGARLEIERMADAAVQAGRHGGPVERVRDLWALWQHGLDVAPRLTVDMSVLQAYLSILAVEVDAPPRNASLSIAEGRVLPTAGVAGRQGLADATAQDIVQALYSLEPQTVVLRTRLLAPTLADAEVATAADAASAFLDEPVTLRHGEREWVWEPNRIAELLAISAEDGQMSVDVNEERLSRAVEGLAQFVDSATAEPRAAFNGSAVFITQPGEIGWRLNQAEAVEAITSALNSGDRTIDLPVEELLPQVTEATLAELGIVELVGEGRSSYAGSAQYRITNIKAGAERLNGVLIAPGEEFSFNRQLGEVNEENGFVQGYAVIGNRTQLEWGGGVCQDSTTVFRAAFWAGLPITERHAHPFYISWYDAYSFPDQAAPGMDATIYTGVQDLKFVNDTGNWLLMEAITDDVNQVMMVRLYGTKPNRTVAISGPEVVNVVPPPGTPVYIEDSSLPAGTVQQSDVARQGMDINVYRIITEDGIAQPPELFFTRFKAWPDVYVRGTRQ